MGAESECADWSASVGTAWGKTDRIEGTWLPAVRHLEDAAAVAEVLWDRWLPRVVRERISADLPEGLNDGRIMLSWLAGVHDCGKFSPQFAGQLAHDAEFGFLVDRMRDAGFTFPPSLGGRPEPHSVVGQVLLRNWLIGEHGFRMSAAGRLASVVGAHHGVPPSQQQVTELATAPGRLAPDSVWAQAQAEVLAGMASRTGAESRLPHWGDVIVDSPSLMLLAAVVVAADWLASDTTRFPHSNEASSRSRAQEAAGEVDLPAPWTPTGGALQAPELMQRRFPTVGTGTPRPVQASAVSAARCARRPPLLIVEAGTGEGKTEAALLAAEVLAARFGCGGVLFALPTQATSDGIFPRLTGWIDCLEADGAQSVFLAHGKAALNDEYQGLARDARIRGVGDPRAEEADTPSAVVSAWLSGRRKGVLANMVVGTIDQLLFAALRARFVHLRQLAIAGKVVIVDEVHAADEFMRVYLIAVLRWLSAHGTPVVVMSATLPPQVRRELIEAYESGRSGSSAPVVDDGRDQLPRLTLADGQVTSVPVEAGGHVTRHVRVDLVQDGSWLDRVVEAVQEGACVAVIQNTVAAAREAYTTLAQRLDPTQVELLHSQFLAPHRLSRERRLRELLGPPHADGSTPNRPHGFVICATQVIEQSLDIDVDLMVSQIAPVDLLIQRVGRLHRHRRGAGETRRPAGHREPVLILTGVTGLQNEPEFDPGSVAVYGASGLLRSLVILRECGWSVRSPTDVAALVRRGYDPGLQAPNEWADALAVADRDRHAAVASQRRRAADFALQEPVRVGALTGLLNGATEDPEMTGGRARVRDTDDSLDAIVVVERADGLHPVPDAGVEDVLLPTELSPPPDNVARRLARCTVRLPRQLTHPGVIDATIAAMERMGEELTGWQKSRWLSGQLVLILDEGMGGSLHSFRIRYDFALGLVCEKGDAT